MAKQRAHGGQAETGQRAVERGEPQRGHRLHLPPRQAQSEAGPQQVDHPHQADAGHRRHADMEARNRDQMRSAIGARHLPIALAQATRVADGEGAQQGGGADIRNTLRNAIGDRRTPAIDAPWRAKVFIGRTIAHITRGDDATLQRTAFAIGTAGIDQPARPLEPQHQPPARARNDGGNRRTAGGVPRNPHHAIQRDRLAAQRRLLHVQQEPRHLLAHLRQTSHGTDHDQIAPFQRRRQARLHRPRTAPRGPGGTEHHQGNDTRPRRIPREPDHQDQQRHRPAFRRQHRHPLHRQHAGKKRRRQQDRSVVAHRHRPSVGDGSS
jgi:hypothetical protein